MVKPSTPVDQQLDRLAPAVAVAFIVCLFVSIFAPTSRIRSPEAEALEAALAWTGWFFVGGSLACGLIWIVLALRRPPRRARKDGALERISQPPQPAPTSANLHWLAVAFHAVTSFGVLTGRAPATLETLISVGGPRALFSGAAWLGMLALGMLIVAHSAHLAIRAGRAVAEAA